MEIYKLVYQYSHTHPIPNTPNSSLTNTKNRENLASYSKLENSHNNMQQPNSLFHSTILSVSRYFHLHNWCNTYPYIGYQVGKDESLYYMQLLYVYLQSTTPSKDKLKYFKQNSNGLFGLRGREEEQSRVEQSRFSTKLTYFQPILLYFPPLSLLPPSIQTSHKSHLKDIQFATIPNQSIYFEHVRSKTLIPS